MPRSLSEIESAIEVFVHGHAAGRSRTHPCEVLRQGPLWVTRDVPRKNPRDYRNEEWTALNLPAAEVDRIVRRHTRGRYFVCAITPHGEPEAPTRADYRQLGYRLVATEPFFVHSLRRIARADSPARIEQVRTEDLARQLGKATRSKPIPLEDLGNDAPFRQYVALLGGEIAGWVRSVDAAGATWCANMQVREEFRRQGIGRALLSRMLRDDRRRGVPMSVLLATHTGALLYPRVGYEPIGMLFLYKPLRPHKPV